MWSTAVGCHHARLHLAVPICVKAIHCCFALGMADPELRCSRMSAQVVSRSLYRLPLTQFEPASCLPKLCTVCAISFATAYSLLCSPPCSWKKLLCLRTGRGRCLRVSWADTDPAAAGSAPSKDANDVLVQRGPEGVQHCIQQAKPLPNRMQYMTAAN